MSGDQPFAGHDPAVTLLLLCVGLIATPWLLVRGVGLLRREGTAFRAAGVFAWAGAVGVYCWGLSQLVFFDGPDMSRACDSAVRQGELAGYEASFVPLRFGCRVTGGATVDVYLPSYVNVVAAVCVVCAVVLTVHGRRAGRAVQGLVR
ncbi:hypothetical protein [Streptomyces acidiscabies]|uniref:hypothetical protein n=1 Tax=Streptomyces acidiscabies TaxID=42234 RepID=UPI0038F79DDE